MTNDMFAASTMAAPAEVENFAWSECDDPYYQECAVDLYDEPDHDDELDEPTSWWSWAFVTVVSAAAALAIAIVVGRAFVAFLPEPPSTAPHSSTVPPIPPGGFIGNHWDWIDEPAQNT